jgi:hypothetical protein
VTSCRGILVDGMVVHNVRPSFTHASRTADDSVLLMVDGLEERLEVSYIDEE